MRAVLCWLVLLPFSVFCFESAGLRLIEVDPGHPHAAALHARMLPGFSDEAHIYAPLGNDVTAHLNRIAQFNQRPRNPTHWSLKVYAGPDFLQQMLREPPGNVVVLSGRNGKKIDYIEAALRGGQNVLADKPWIIELRDLPRMEAALKLAADKHLVAYDCMTLRFDAAYRLQRELVSDRQIFGEPDPGTPENPAVRLENLHALLKMSASGPGLRPAWYFDIRQQGEGIADVGTHLVDLVEWTLFAEQPIEYRRDVKVLRARRWPTVLTRAQFGRVTGERSWPSYLGDAVADDQLQYFTNTEAVFSIRGVNILLNTKWEYEAPVGVKDSYFASYQGTHSRIEVRARAAENYTPELFVIPKEEYWKEVLARLRVMRPGSVVEIVRDGALHVPLSPAERASDQNDFARLADRFLEYVHDPGKLPSWETPDLVAKYYITTRCVQMAREAHP
jgi:predicted dehydrogenase